MSTTKCVLNNVGKKIFQAQYVTCDKKTRLKSEIQILQDKDTKLRNDIPLRNFFLSGKIFTLI